MKHRISVAISITLLMLALGACSIGGPGSAAVTQVKAETLGISAKLPGSGWEHRLFPQEGITGGGITGETWINKDKGLQFTVVARKNSVPIDPEVKKFMEKEEKELFQKEIVDPLFSQEDFHGFPSAASEDLLCDIGAKHASSC